MKTFVQLLFKNRLIFHYLFWILIIVSYFVAHTDYIEKVGWPNYLLTIILRHAILMFLVYGNINFLLPRFYTGKKYFLYFILLLALVATFILLQWLFINYFPGFLGSSKDISEILNFSFWDSLLTALRFTVFAIILKLSIEWYDQNVRIKSMQIEKLEADINFLRAQINPHFLFNTLNSIYALTLKKSDDAPNAVMLLSKMMSYMLHESNELYVPLKLEVENLKNYIEIEKLRMGNNLRIKFDIDGELNNLMIAPHVFLPFVENAFKHGSNNRSGKVDIDIMLNIQSNKLLFRITNSIKDSQPLKADLKGLGLKNAKRRLDLFYKNNYTLEIQSQQEAFVVGLNIQDIKPGIDVQKRAFIPN